MSINNKKSKNIPAFLLKTYNMLQDPSNDIALQWSPNGIGFIILNDQILTKVVLPKYFKHSNYSSFIRQLNMYDFHKIRKGSIQNYFHHDKFIKGDLNSIAQIKRKPEKKKTKIYTLVGLKQSYEKLYGSDSQIGSKKQSPIKNKTEITLNSVHTIKAKSEQSIILMRQNINMLNSKVQPIYYEQCQSHNDNRFSQIDLNRGDSYENEQQNHHNNDQDSSKMSINNQIQSKYIIQQPKQILIPSHNNIFHLIHPYQFANFGLFM